MKKLLCFSVICTLIMTLSACGDGTNSGDNKSTGSDYSSASTQSVIGSASDKGGESVGISEENSQSASDQSGDGQGGQPAMTDDYAARIEKGLEDATISDMAFIEYYKSLGEYDPAGAVVADAKYASPNGSGEGTKDNPYELQEAFDELKAGDTLYLRGGTYELTDADGLYLSAKGSTGKYITIRNYPGEQPIIKNKYVGKEASAIQIDGGACYIVIEGLEISGVTSRTACGIAVYGNGQNHIIIRNNKLHDIKTNSSDPENDEDAGANGILLLGENNKSVNNFIIADNDIRDNVTGWSESLSVAGNCEYIYVLGNTVDNNTNIGIDFYGKCEIL